MNFLRRFDNRLIKQGETSSSDASKIGETETSNDLGENESVVVLNPDPNEYEIDTSPVTSNTALSPANNQSSKKKALDDGNNPDGRKETPRLFQRKLFQRTPPKTPHQNQPRESQKASENNYMETTPSADTYETSHLIENSSGPDTNDPSTHESEPQYHGQVQGQQEPTHEPTQENTQSATYSRTLEPWENWDEDFYNLLSTSVNFVSSSAMSLASALASASSKLTDDLIEVENNNNNNNNGDGDESQANHESKRKSKELNDIDILEDQQSVTMDGVSKFTMNSNTSMEEQYNNYFTLNFIKELAHIGLMLTYYDTSQEDMKSNLVLMRIEPGMKEETQLLEPKVSWVQVQAGKETSSTKQSIKILDIHSVTAPESESTEEGSDLHFIIITETGAVHVFECVTASDRDRALYGLRNVIAWLSYNLIMGSLVASQFDEDRKKEHALSLGSQLKSMNHLIAPFLD